MAEECILLLFLIEYSGTEYIMNMFPEDVSVLAVTSNRGGADNPLVVLSKVSSSDYDFVEP